MESESRWVKGVVEDLTSGRLTWDHESLTELGRQSTLQAGIGDAWRSAKMA
jgi:hypothetical protein